MYLHLHPLYANRAGKKISIGYIISKVYTNIKTNSLPVQNKPLQNYL